MTVYTSNTGNGYYLRLTVTAYSQNVAANQSTLSWVLQIQNPSTYFNANSTGSCVINGTTVWSVSGKVNSSPSGSLKTLGSGSIVVNHAANGTASVPVSAAFRTVTQGQSWSVPQLNLSGTFVPPTIPRVPGQPSPPSVTHVQAQRYLNVVSSIPSGVTPTSYEMRVRNSLGGVWRDWVSYTMALSTRSYSYAPPYVTPVGFQFQTRAYGAGAWGPWSDATLVTPAWVPYTLGLPSYSTSRADQTITAVAPVADAGGTPILEYQIQLTKQKLDGTWTLNAVYTTNLTTRAYTHPVDFAGQRFRFRARARTVAGWSQLSSDYVEAIAAGQGPYIRVAGTWKQSDCFVKVAGVWRPARPYVRVNGTWRTLI